MLQLACLHPSYTGAQGHSNTGNTIYCLVNDVPVNPETQPCNCINKRHYGSIGNLSNKTFPCDHRLSRKPHEYKCSLPVEPVCIKRNMRRRMEFIQKQVKSKRRKEE